MTEICDELEYGLLRNANEVWLQIKVEAADAEQEKIDRYLAKIEMALDRGDETDVKKFQAGMRSHTRKLKALNAEIEELLQKIIKIDIEYNHIENWLIIEEENNDFG